MAPDRDVSARPEPCPAGCPGPVGGVADEESSAAPVGADLHGSVEAEAGAVCTWCLLPWPCPSAPNRPDR